MPLPTSDNRAESRRVNLPRGCVDDLQRGVGCVELLAQLSSLGVSDKKPSAFVDVAFHPLKPWVAAIEPKGCGVVWDYETSEVVTEFDLGESQVLDDDELHGSEASEDAVDGATEGAAGSAVFSPAAAPKGLLSRATASPCSAARSTYDAADPDEEKRKWGSTGRGNPPQHPATPSRLCNAGWACCDLAVHELRFHSQHDVMTAASRDGTIFFFDVAPLLDSNKPATLTGLLPSSKLQSVIVLPGAQKGCFTALSTSPLNSTLVVSEIMVKGRYSGKDNVPTIFTEFAISSTQESRDLRAFVSPNGAEAQASATIERSRVPQLLYCPWQDGFLAALLPISGHLEVGLKPVPPNAVHLQTIFAAHAFAFAWHPSQPLFAVLA
uniref:Uncharacterized protein n=1 Tax=Phytophthora ramorum TaxID=164328 RepID=H3HC12_PHYRM